MHFHTQYCVLITYEIFDVVKDFTAQALWV